MRSLRDSAERVRLKSIQRLASTSFAINVSRLDPVSQLNRDQLFVLPRSPIGPFPTGLSGTSPRSAFALQASKRSPEQRPALARRMQPSLGTSSNSGRDHWTRSITLSVGSDFFEVNVRAGVGKNADWASPRQNARNWGSKGSLWQCIQNAISCAREPPDQQIARETADQALFFSPS